MPNRRVESGTVWKRGDDVVKVMHTYRIEGELIARVMDIVNRSEKRILVLDLLSEYKFLRYEDLTDLVGNLLEGIRRK